MDVIHYAFYYVEHEKLSQNAERPDSKKYSPWNETGAITHKTNFLSPSENHLHIRTSNTNRLNPLMPHARRPFLARKCKRFQISGLPAFEPSGEIYDGCQCEGRSIFIVSLSCTQLQSWYMHIQPVR